MTRFMVLNTHSPEQCDQMEEGATDLPAALKGRDFYCTCPAGEHAFYMFLDGNTSEEVLGTLPQGLRVGKTRAVEVDIWQL